MQIIADVQVLKWDIRNIGIESAGQRFGGVFDMNVVEPDRSSSDHLKRDSDFFCLFGDGDGAVVFFPVVCDGGSIRLFRTDDGDRLMTPVILRSDELHVNGGAADIQRLDPNRHSQRRGGFHSRQALLPLGDREKFYVGFFQAEAGVTVVGHLFVPEVLHPVNRCTALPTRRVRLSFFKTYIVQKG